MPAARSRPVRRTGNGCGRPTARARAIPKLPGEPIRSYRRRPTHRAAVKVPIPAVTSAAVDARSDDGIPYLRGVRSRPTSHTTTRVGVVDPTVPKLERKPPEPGRLLPAWTPSHRARWPGRGARSGHRFRPLPPARRPPPFVPVPHHPPSRSPAACSAESRRRCGESFHQILADRFVASLAECPAKNRGANYTAGRGSSQSKRRTRSTSGTTGTTNRNTARPSAGR